MKLSNNSCKNSFIGKTTLITTDTDLSYSRGSRVRLGKEKEGKVERGRDKSEERRRRQLILSFFSVLGTQNVIIYVSDC